MADVALLFRTLSGQDPHDPASPPVALREPSLDELRRNAIGFFEDDGLVPVTPETRAAVQAAAARAARCRLSRGAVPSAHSGAVAQVVVEVLCAVRGHVLCAGDSWPGAISLVPIFNEFLGIAEAVPPLTATELLERVGGARPAARKDAGRDERISRAALPRGQHSRVSPRRARVDRRGPGREYLDAVRHTQWFNALAAPAAVVPVGHSPEGLPIGVQIVARPFEDETALGVAAIVDAAFGYQAATDRAPVDVAVRPVSSIIDNMHLRRAETALAGATARRSASPPLGGGVERTAAIL